MVSSPRNGFSRRRFSKRRFWQQVGLVAALALILTWTLGPYYWLVVSALSAHADLITVPVRWFPQHPTLSSLVTILNFHDVTGERFVQAFRNSVLVAGGTTLASLVLGTLAAYALARFPIRGKNSFTVGMMATRLLPTIALVIPFYVLIVGYVGRYVALYDTKINLVILYTSFVLGLVIWIMRGYFLTVPRELEEAARIDGCSRLQALRWIMLPLASPALVATALLAFLLAWDEFLLALIFTRTGNAFTLPYFIYTLGSQYLHAFNQVQAAGLVASLPPVVLAIIFGRYIVSGLTAGGVKG